MRVLVVGSGGREHALVWKLAQEAEVFALPGNPGIAEICDCIPGRIDDFESVAAAARSCAVDFVLFGPEGPLVTGLADALRDSGIAVFGPGAAGARLEGSKAFSKAMMARAGVPTAAFASFTEPQAAKAFAASLDDRGRRVVVKASGNALGKGVTVCESLAEAHEAIDSMLVEREFGEAGSEIVVEERLDGFEFSLLTICSGTSFLSLPIAKDHKRALDGDRGPNTGGMGTVSPALNVDADLVEATEQSVVLPMLRELANDGVDYRGILFSGLMVDEGKPYCLEYNVRFGDPETQSVVRRLGIGFAESLESVASGGPALPIPVRKDAAATVVIASGGYPGAYEVGREISIGPLPPDVVAFHAGTKVVDGRLVTAGGRVLAISAVGPSVEHARSMAYSGVGQIHFEGMRYRADIGA